MDQCNVDQNFAGTWMFCRTHREAWPKSESIICPEYRSRASRGVCICPVNIEAVLSDCPVHGYLVSE